MPPSEEASRTFKASVDEVRDAASDALASLGAKVEESEDRMSLAGTTGWTLLSWGEKVQITLQSRKDGVHVTVHSTPRFRFALADAGKTNQKNVGSVLNTMTTRLS